MEVANGRRHDDPIYTAGKYTNRDSYRGMDKPIASDRGLNYGLQKRSCHLILSASPWLVNPFPVASAVLLVGLPMHLLTVANAVL